MIEVHHLNNSRSQRVLWLLEELGLDYGIVAYARDPATMLAPAALRAVHPLGKSPVIRDGALTLAESGAIIEYLVEREGGKLRPEAGTPARLRYLYWLHFAEGSAMTPLLLKLYLSRVGPAAAAVMERAEAQIASILSYLEAELAPGGHFAGGEFSAADIQMTFPLEAAAARGGLDGSYPRLSEYLQRMQSRPGYRRAIERGGPYALLR